MTEGVVVGLGANLGDGEGTLAAAIDALADTPGIRVRAVSDLYRTAPVGGPEQPDYVNAAVLLATDLDPHALLDRLHELEQAHGRERTVRWGPRTLDLDVLLFGGLAIDDPDLVVPHPRLVERRFALEPLLDVLPQAALPDGRRLADLVPALPDQGVARVGPLPSDRNHARPGG